LRSSSNFTAVLQVRMVIERYSGVPTMRLRRLFVR
jgi:hypothetical protein